MIINTKSKVAVNDIVAFKLVTGEELIGKLTAIDGDAYTIEKPVVLALVPTGNGQATVSFAPFMMGLDEGSPIEVEYSKMLMRPVVARKDAASQYIRSTSNLDLSAAT